MIIVGSEFWDLSLEQVIELCQNNIICGFKLNGVIVPTREIVEYLAQNWPEYINKILQTANAYAHVIYFIKKYSGQNPEPCIYDFLEPTTPVRVMTHTEITDIDMCIYAIKTLIYKKVIDAGIIQPPWVELINECFNLMVSFNTLLKIQNIDEVSKFVSFKYPYKIGALNEITHCYENKAREIAQSGNQEEFDKYVKFHKTFDWDIDHPDWNLATVDISIIKPMPTDYAEWNHIPKDVLIVRAPTGYERDKYMRYLIKENNQTRFKQVFNINAEYYDVNMDEYTWVCETLGIPPSSIVITIEKINYVFNVWPEHKLRFAEPCYRQCNFECIIYILNNYPGLIDDKPGCPEYIQSGDIRYLEFMKYVLIHTTGKPSWLPPEKFILSIQSQYYIPLEVKSWYPGIFDN